MPVTFVLGRAGSGKTHYCLQAILDELRHEDRSAPAILLVPEQASFQMERALALGSVRRGFLRAEVLSFSRLSRRVLASVGAPLAEVDAAARQMLVKSVLARMPAPLPAFARAATLPGFHRGLARLIETLIRENVPVGRLRSAAATEEIDEATAARLAAVDDAYAAYTTALGDRIDVLQRPARMRDALHRATWLRGARIWVDGFAGFTGQELATLVALAGVADALTITLLLEPAQPVPIVAPGGGDTTATDSLRLFRRTQQTYARLRSDLVAAGVSCAPPVKLAPALLPRFVSAPALARLELHLAMPDVAPANAPTAAASPPASVAPPASPASDVRVLSCATPLEELRAAARFIRAQRLAASGPLNWRDFALITRDLEPLAGRISEVFDEYEIPYFLDRRRPLRAHPLFRLIDALFEALLEDGPVEVYRRLLRTGLLPLSRDAAERLEEVVIAHRVRGLARWLADRWDFADEATARRESGPRLTAAAQHARQSIAAALAPFFSPVDGGAAGAAWSQRVARALEALDVRTTLARWVESAQAAGDWEAAQTHGQAWEAVRTALDTAADLLSDVRLSAREFAAVLVGTLRDATLGLTPPRLDQVLVTSIERSRHPDVRHAWLLAFNEGVFPRPPADDEVLSRADREQAVAAGIDALTPRQEDVFGERLLAYIAMTRPSQSLTISYARADDAGEPLAPSPLLDEVLAAVPDLLPADADAAAPPATLREFARAYLGAQDEPDAAGARVARAAACRRVREALAGGPHAATLDDLLRGENYSNAPAPLEPPPSDRTTIRLWSGTPTEIEDFLRCPFKHFAARRLSVRSAVHTRPLRWDLGEIAHTLLAAVTRKAVARAGDLKTTDDATWTAWLDDAISEWRGDQTPDFADRRADLALGVHLLDPFVREVLLVHAERWRRGAFRPLRVEAPFAAARGAPLAPLRIITDDRRLIVIHGQIDRLDVVEHDGVRWQLVYDYKTSPTRPGGVLIGQWLQLLTYLLAVNPRGRGRRRAAGVLVAPLFPDFKADPPRYVATAPPADLRLHAYRPTGIVSRPAVDLLDPAATKYSPIANITRTRTGFDRRCGVVEQERIDDLLQQTREILVQAARGIAGGEVSPSPLVENRTLACGTCSFRPICRFERPLNAVRAAEALLPRLSGGDEGDGE